MMQMADRGSRHGIDSRTAGPPVGRARRSIATDDGSALAGPVCIRQTDAGQRNPDVEISRDPPEG